jgi:hypothetical protein
VKLPKIDILQCCGLVRYRVDADPNSDPTSHFGADPDPDPDPKLYTKITKKF